MVDTPNTKVEVAEKAGPVTNSDGKTIADTGGNGATDSSASTDSNSTSSGGTSIGGGEDMPPPTEAELVMAHVMAKLPAVNANLTGFASLDVAYTGGNTADITVNVDGLSLYDATKATVETTVGLIVDYSGIDSYKIYFSNPDERQKANKNTDASAVAELVLDALSKNDAGGSFTVMPDITTTMSDFAVYAHGRTVKVDVFAPDSDTAFFTFIFTFKVSTK